MKSGLFCILSIVISAIVSIEAYAVGHAAAVSVVLHANRARRANANRHYGYRHRPRIHISANVGNCAVPPQTNGVDVQVEVQNPQENRDADQKVSCCEYCVMKTEDCIQPDGTETCPVFCCKCFAFSAACPCLYMCANLADCFDNCGCISPDHSNLGAPPQQVMECNPSLPAVPNAVEVPSTDVPTLENGDLENTTQP